MPRSKIEKLDINLQESKELVYMFYYQHYEAPGHLLPSSIAEIEGTYYVLKRGSTILGLTKHTRLAPNLVMSSGTVIHREFRGVGNGGALWDGVEQRLRDDDIKKVTCNIYTDNLPSIIFKLKSGFVIEGLLRNHEGNGKDEYILGKVL